MKFLKCISLFWMFFLSSTADAQKVFEFRDFRGTVKYTGEVAYWLDTTFKLNSAQIDRLSNLPISEKVIPDLGWGKFRGWIKMNVKSKAERQLFLQIHNPVFDEISVYLFQNGKQISGVENIRKGMLFKPNSFRLLTVPLSLQKDSVYQIYVSVFRNLILSNFRLDFLTKTVWTNFVIPKISIMA